MCAGRQSVTIRDKKIHGVAPTSQGKVDTRPVGTPLFDVGGSCELRIEDCDIEAPLVLRAGGNAKIRLIGGRLASTTTVLSVGGNAQIQVEGTKLEGHIERSGNARIVGLPDLDQQQSREDLSRKYGATACDDLRPCLQQQHYSGNLATTISGLVEPSGKIVEVKLEGLPTAELSACVRDRMMKRTLAGYDGKPGGKLVCKVSGSVIENSEMLLTSPNFER